MNGIKGVTFGDIHTSSFGIYLSNVTVGSPEPKQFLVDIPGADGSLDMSGYFGGVKYENRKITLVFTFPQKGKQLLYAYSDFLAAVHGKYFDSIILDDDPDFHYVGRISVGKLSKSVISKVNVECDCQPFKYGNTKNLVTINVVAPEFPDGWLYGDINGDSVIDRTDLSLMDSLIGKRSFESDAALYADFDFDGIVTRSEKDALENYLKFPGAYTSFKDHVTAEPVSLNFRNCRRKIIDFGSSPVNVDFTVISIDRTRLWELRIDNVPQFLFSSRKSYSMTLSGSHEIMIVTGNAYTTGSFGVSWDNAGTL